MRIVLITRRFPPAPGGVEKQVWEISHRLRRRGHAVSVHTSDLYSDIPLRRLSTGQHDYQGIQVRRYVAIPIPFRRVQGTSLTPGMLFASVAATRAPDLVHAQGFNLVTVSAALLAQRAKRSRTICTTHLDPNALSSGPAVKILSQFDGLVALTDIERELMLKLGLDGGKIRVIPNGIDTRTFSNPPHPTHFRSMLGIESRLILYAGRIDIMSKGCDLLIEAVSLAQERIGECIVVFAGPDWGSQKYLQALSESKRVQVLFTGNLGSKDLMAAYVACDVLVLPSLTESLPVSILEGMLCGAPIVATRVGGVPSIVRHEDTGLLVPPGDSRELANAICRVLQDHQLSAHIVANARKLAGRYSIERTVAQLESFYAEILGR
jgi:glycosyltransferase involved in cell wall biosynthesis